jgi:hypothetical protein
MNDSTGGQGRVQMERVGLVQAQYADTAGASEAEGLMPVAWKLLLKPWRAPDMASIPLSIPHPMEYAMGGWGWTWWMPAVQGDTPPDPDYFDGWGENASEWPWSAVSGEVEPAPPGPLPLESGFSPGYDEGYGS